MLPSINDTSPIPCRRSPYAKRGYRRRGGRVLHAAEVHRGHWGLPYLTKRIERTHNFEHVFDFERNPRTDARPLQKSQECYGSPWDYPGDDYPGWPAGTSPDEGAFV